MLSNFPQRSLGRKPEEHKRNQQFNTNCGAFKGAKTNPHVKSMTMDANTVCDQRETAWLQHGRSDGADGHSEAVIQRPEEVAGCSRARLHKQLQQKVITPVFKGTYLYYSHERTSVTSCRLGRETTPGVSLQWKYVTIKVLWFHNETRPPVCCHSTAL